MKLSQQLFEDIQAAIARQGTEAANEIVKVIQDAIGMAHAPVAAVQWVPIDKVEANDYNPNRVGRNDLRLLAVSIRHDGYTQPVVTVYDEARGKYVIVDGFHRYLIMKTDKAILRDYRGLLPVVVLNKTPQERMAATVRHNRARGRHTIAGMGRLVVDMKAEGATEQEICNQLGLEPDELARVSHMTGVASLFKDREYGKAYKTTKQIEVESGKD